MDINGEEIDVNVGINSGLGTEKILYVDNDIIVVI
jgi:non-canonical (house-cleaning) NTP pyrophosphatase